MNKMVIIMQKGKSASITILVILLIALSFKSYSQLNLNGTYCINYKLSDFYTCLTFYENNKFKYKDGGDLGDHYHGDGSFQIINDKLILNYNNTQLNELSGYYQYSNWANNKNSITLNFKVMDMQGNSLSDINIVVLSEREGVTTDKNGMASLKLNGLKNNTSEITVSEIGFKTQFIPFNRNLNYSFNVYLKEYSKGTPILNQIDTLEIIEIGNSFFKTNNLKGKINLWKKN